MSILNVNTIQPIGSGTTVTIATTELKTSNFITVGTGASVTSPSANVLTLGTNSAERLRITSAGLIGIGTVSPSGPIHAHVASGTQRTYLEASAAHSFLRLKSGSTSYNSGVEFFSGASNIANINGLGAGGLQFEVNGSERVRITSDGKVLIGTDTAATNTELTIRASSPHLSLYATPGQDSRLNMGDTDDHDIGMIAYANSDNSMRFTTNATERLRIDSSGFITQKFTSNNSTTAEGLFINNLNNGTGNNASLILSNDSGERKKAAIALIDTGSYGAGDLVFALDGADSGELHLTNDEKLRITSDGHVLPGANNTHDLGSTAKGWRNVYMNDLNLSNMNGDTNDVDGTQGSWTIQEGKDDLYIINRLNGKKFKIKMEEIS